MNDIASLIVGSAGAATIANYLVALFKLAAPSASSAAIAAVALLSGQLSALLTTAASGGLALSQQAIATVVVTGILATAAAAGLSRTDQTAEAKRIGSDVQAQRVVVAELGAKAEKEAAK